MPAPALEIDPPDAGARRLRARSDLAEGARADLEVSRSARAGFVNALSRLWQREHVQRCRVVRRKLYFRGNRCQPAEARGKIRDNRNVLLAPSRVSDGEGFERVVQHRAGPQLLTGLLVDRRDNVLRDGLLGP